jgi:hypothetical protein
VKLTTLLICPSLKMRLTGGRFYTRLSKVLFLYHGVLVFKNRIPKTFKILLSSLMVTSHFYAFIVDSFNLVNKWHLYETIPSQYRRVTMWLYSTLCLLGIVEMTMKLKDLQNMFYKAEEIQQITESVLLRSRYLTKFLITIFYLLAALQDEYFTIEGLIESHQFSLADGTIQAIHSVLRCFISPFMWVVSYNAVLACLVDLELVESFSDHIMFQENLQSFIIQLPLDPDPFSVPQAPGSSQMNDSGSVMRPKTFASNRVLKRLSMEKDYNLHVVKYYYFVIMQMVMANIVYIPTTLHIGLSGESNNLNLILTWSSLILANAVATVPMLIMFCANYKKRRLAVRLQKDFYSSKSKSTRKLMRKFRSSLNDEYRNSPFLLFNWEPSFFLAIQDAEILATTSLYS